MKDGECENAKEPRSARTDAAHDTKTSRPPYKRGVGLTPRLFDALMHAKNAPIEALPSAYVPAINQHVQSVGPSKQVMAQLWCPVVVEDDAGARHVLHVDPIEVRQYRRGVTDELQQVKEKRKRMLARIKSIRQEFPKAHACDVQVRLKRELAEAEGRDKEPLLRGGKLAARVLHVFVEATAHMVQLELVRERLLSELPQAWAGDSIQQISLTALTGDGSSPLVPPLPPINCRDRHTLQAVGDWLRDLVDALVAAAAATQRKGPIGKDRGGYHLAKPLRGAMTARALSTGGSIVLLVTCSQPVDLEVCVGLVRRSEVVLKIAGVLGTSPNDPEPGLRQLASAGFAGSSTWLYFGTEYWTRFISARTRQLERVEKEIGDSETHGWGDGDESEIVSAKVFEVRLMERVMRECYAQEQHCEEELVCASRVLERTLIDRDDMLTVLRDKSTSTATCT